MRGSKRRYAPRDGSNVSYRQAYLKPVEGCPTYNEYFKEGDNIPGRLCNVHEGSVKQEIKRAVQGFFRGLGRKLKGIFK